MKRLVPFVLCVLQECGTLCNVDTTRDSQTISRRIQDEGQEFLTLALPQFANDFERSLDQRTVGTEYFEGFNRPFESVIPSLFDGFMRLIFDPTSGSLLDNPSVDAIRAIRQICRLVQKINIPCSKEREDAAFTAYVQCEKDIRTKAEEDPLTSGEQKDFALFSELLFGDMFYKIESKLLDLDFMPRHSSGSTADGLLGNGKYYQVNWPLRLQLVVPWDFALLPSARYASETYPVNILEPGDEMPVKVITVPKTQKAPRIIAMEPTCMQYVQQGLLRLIQDESEKSEIFSTFCPLNDQAPNQRLARQGSRGIQADRPATLDLSEASDRVSLEHVKLLLSRHPLLLEYVMACRSLTALVPSYGTIPLAKFASMGSALCFPFETMIFTVIATLATAKGSVNLSWPREEPYKKLRKRLLKGLRGRVHVYGDDIIVPSDSVLDVVSMLTTFGYQVNEGKSFWSGNFRESCGKEYFSGSDVTTVRVRERFPHYVTDVDQLVSTVSLHNQLFSAGMFASADFISEVLRPFHLAEALPGVDSILALWSYTPTQKVRFDHDLHKPMVRAHKLINQSPINSVDDHQALMKFFVERGEIDPLPRSSYQRSGRSRVRRIKLGWYEALVGTTGDFPPVSASESLPGTV